MVFFGTTVTLHNSGHQPALKTYMANRFFSTRTKPKVIVSYEEKLCHELDHDIAGGQVIFPGASTDVPINDGGISLKDVGDTQSLSGEILVGCVSYADPSDGWHFLNGTKRHTTGFVFNVQTKSPIKGMYGFVPIDKTTPGSEIIYTPGVIQEGTAD